MTQYSFFTRRYKSRLPFATALILLSGLVMFVTACVEPSVQQVSATTGSDTTTSGASKKTPTPTSAEKIRVSATASAEWIAENWAEQNSVSYSDLFRNIDLLEGDRYRFTGKVIQVLDAENDEFQMRISITRDRSSWSDPVMVYHTGVRILEDDFVRFIGVIIGPLTYESALGAQITVPSIIAERIQVVNEDVASSDDVSIVARPEVSPTATTSTTDLESDAPRTEFGDGTWRIGIDVQPGTYFSEASDDCYWQRLAGLSGSSSEILANDNTDARAVVEILPSDVGFDSSRCGEWIALQKALP